MVSTRAGRSPPKPGNLWSGASHVKKALQNFKTTYFLRATHIFAGKKGSKIVNLGALMCQLVE